MNDGYNIYKKAAYSDCQKQCDVWLPTALAQTVPDAGTSRCTYAADGTVKPYLAFTDNLGSILSVMDEDGNKVFDASYDAWGRQAVTLNTIGLHRGYTGHEMLDEFDIINMNGRLYDPVLGRFFSPNPYVQMPDFSQSFNRYSYCLNNPLKYTDPSGELFGIDDAVIAFAAFNIGTSMMQAAFDGKNVWKARALSLLSSAASYGIGAVFGNTGSIGHELLRAGAHGLAGGVIGALDGGNFFNSFISGTEASGMGSFAQAARINEGLMLASTATMGGAMAWVTGGDFLQGAMQGLTTGLFNHALHDGNDGIRYHRDNYGNIYGEIPEVVVTSSRTGQDLTLDVAAGANTILGCVGASLKKNGGNSTFGNNGKFYWHTANERGFYGNQHVNTIRLAQIGKRITEVVKPVGRISDAYTIFSGVATDIQDYNNGYTNGYNTVRATADVTGGWAGGWAGLKVGVLLGGCVGSVPGAIIGGFVGGVGGALGGSYVGTLIIDKVYGR